MSNSSQVNSPFILRQKRLAETCIKKRFRLYRLEPGPSLMYLTGLNFHLMEDRWQLFSCQPRRRYWCSPGSKASN